MVGWTWMGLVGATQIIAVGYFLFCKLKQDNMNCNTRTYRNKYLQPIVSFICCIKYWSPFYRISTGVHATVIGGQGWEVYQQPKSGRCTVGGWSEAMAVAAEQRITSMDDVDVWRIRRWNLEGDKPLLVGDRGCGDAAVGLAMVVVFCLAEVRNECWCGRRLRGWTLNILHMLW